MKKAGYRKCRGKCQKEKPYGMFGRYNDAKKTMHVVCKKCRAIQETEPLEEKPEIKPIEEKKYV